MSDLEVVIVAKESKKYELNKKDMKKVWRGLLIALGGATLTYTAQTLPNIDFGAWTPTMTALGAVLINLAWKYLRGNK